MHFGPKNNIFAYISGFPCYFLLKLYWIDRHMREMWFLEFFSILDQISPNLGNKCGIFELKNIIFANILGFPCSFLLKFCRIDRNMREMRFFGNFSIFAQIFPNLGNKYGIFGPKNNNVTYILVFPCHFLLKFCQIDHYMIVTVILRKFWFFSEIHPLFNKKYGIFWQKNNIVTYNYGISFLLLLRFFCLHRYMLVKVVFDINLTMAQILVKINWNRHVRLVLNFRVKFFNLGKFGHACTNVLGNLVTFVTAFQWQLFCYYCVGPFMSCLL